MLYSNINVTKKSGGFFSEAGLPTPSCSGSSPASESSKPSKRSRRARAAKACGWFSVAMSGGYRNRWDDLTKNFVNGWLRMTSPRTWNDLTQIDARHLRSKISMKHSQLGKEVTWKGNRPPWTSQFLRRWSCRLANWCRLGLSEFQDQANFIICYNKSP